VLRNQSLSALAVGRACLLASRLVVWLSYEQACGAHELAALRELGL
jgi:hypothetical protein